MLTESEGELFSKFIEGVVARIEGDQLVGCSICNLKGRKGDFYKVGIKLGIIKYICGSCSKEVVISVEDDIRGNTIYREGV